MSIYVDNQKMFVEFLRYRKAIKQAKKNKKKKPCIPEYLGECFLLIATRLANRPNFINYMYRDDMVSDGIENCILYLDNFNPRKSKNPFAYFTQIIYYAFVRRIKKEKKQLYIKLKSAQNSMDTDTLVSYNNDDSIEGVVPTFMNMKSEKVKKIITDFEENLLKNKVKLKKAKRNRTR